MSNAPEIIAAMAEKQSISLADAVEATGVSKSTAYRLLAPLAIGPGRRNTTGRAIDRAPKLSVGPYASSQGWTFVLLFSHSCRSSGPRPGRR